MTDERLDPIVDGWLKDTDAPPPDPVGSTNLAMANVRRSRQFRRWWPLPIAERFRSPAIGSPSRELTPASIPATNGHAPAPIGRTRAMFSTSKLAATVAILVLAGGLLWLAVLAPQPEQQAPGAGGERTDFIIVTGTSTLGGGTAPTGVDTMSDPRVGGQVELSNHYVTGHDDLTGAHWGQFTLTNDDGAWEGEWVGFYESAGGDESAVATGAENAMVWASGTGGYEGWSYVANYTGNLTKLDVRGLMYQGDIPTTVALGLLGAEAE